MSQPLQKGTHLNPKYSGAHINPAHPNFKGSSPTKIDRQKSNVHVNPAHPSFKASSSKIDQPNFKNRALPPIPSSPKNSVSKPHINPAFLDGKKTKAYEEAIKMAVEGKIYVNPNFKPKISPTSALEKENMKTPSDRPSVKTPSVFSSATKTLFKKIGQRKLIRVKSNSKLNNRSSQETPKPTKAKVTSRKVIRVPSTKKTLSHKNAANLSLQGTYTVKTDRKIVKRSSPATNYNNNAKKRKRLSNSPTLNVHKKRFKLVKVLNPFRVDRRMKKELKQQQNPKPAPRKIITRSLTPRRQGSNKKISPVNKNFVKINSESQQLGTPFTKKPVPPKPVRKTPVRPNKPATTLINVQGIKYSVSDNGRKLNRVPEKIEEKDEKPVIPVVPNPALNESKILAKKLFIEGEEYIEDEPGVLIRSRNSMTRQSINSAKQRSINTILKSQTRSKQYCMFFNKFGKCKKKEDGVCPYIHDQEKVAVCRKFLQGNCHKEKCLLSHKVAPEKMPTCKFFLEGICTKDPCPYRHVKVNDSAEVCPDFMKGFCPLDQKCLKRHIDVPHPNKKPENVVPSETPSKRVAPAKPKRKSLGHTPMTPLEKKKPRTRYFQDTTEMVTENNDNDTEKKAENEPSASNVDSDFEMKRQRLLKKVEMAKQGWSGMGAVQEATEDDSKPTPTSTSNRISHFLDDSGPYEEIDDVDEDEDDNDDLRIKRPPIGPLPTYISLSKNDDLIEAPENPVQDEEEFDERLI